VCESRAGRGMPEGPPDGVSKTGARGWLRLLGWPRMVPVCDMVAVILLCRQR
jgi:hypothetical protein